MCSMITGSTSQPVIFRNRRSVTSWSDETSITGAPRVSIGPRVSPVVSNGIVSQKVLPSPGVLRTPTRPPIISTSCLVMASPSPVPP